MPAVPGGVSGKYLATSAVVAAISRADTDGLLAAASRLEATVALWPVASARVAFKLAFQVIFGFLAGFGASV